MSISFQTSLSEHEASSIHLLLAFFMTVVENFKENVLNLHTTNAMVKEHVQNFEFFVIFGLFLKNCNIKTERKKMVSKLLRFFKRLDSHIQMKIVTNAKSTQA